MDQDHPAKHYDTAHLEAWQALRRTILQIQDTLTRTQKDAEVQIRAIKHRQSARVRGRRYRKRHDK